MKAIPFVNDSSKLLPWLFVTGLAVALCLVTSSLYCPVCKAGNAPPHASADRSGEMPAGSARTFTLMADMGSVHILPQPAGAAPAVRYTVHLETDAHEPLSQTLFSRYILSFRNVGGTLTLNGIAPRRCSIAGTNAQFSLQFTVYVPSNFSVAVHTGAGDIETGDIGGHALLVTEGGNVTTGRIGGIDHLARLNSAPVAKIETQGGHITVLDVAGDLDAYTPGGFIQARDGAGNAKIRTGGGHIRAAHIRGTAQLETDGGNITVGEAGALGCLRV